MGPKHGQVLVLLADVSGKNQISYLAFHQLPEIRDSNTREAEQSTPAASPTLHISITKSKQRLQQLRLCWALPLPSEQFAADAQLRAEYVSLAALRMTETLLSFPFSPSFPTLKRLNGFELISRCRR